MASFDKTGQLNLYADVGFYTLGLGLTAGPEFILDDFDFSGVPIEMGFAVRGLLGFASYLGVSGIDWGIAPMLTFHWGFDLGGPAKFDWYIGLGLGISSSTVNYGFYSYGTGIGFGFATFDGVAWHFSNNLALILDAGYTGYVGVYGIGLKLNI